MVFIAKMPSSKRSASPREVKAKKQKTTKHFDEELTTVKQHKTTVKKSASKRTYPKEITKESLKIDVSLNSTMFHIYILHETPTHHRDYDINYFIEILHLVYITKI